MIELVDAVELLAIITAIQSVALVLALWALGSDIKKAAIPPVPVQFPPVK